MLAPEIFEGKPISRKVDMWALGVILYELITLKQPFQGISLGEISKNVTTCKFKEIPFSTDIEL
jgi:serine/threonine protein kinase